MASRRGGTCCAAINCSITVYNLQQISLFRFPKDTTRCLKWKANVRRSDLESKSAAELNLLFRLCSKHFEDSQFMNAKRHKLIWNAVPTLFDFTDKRRPMAQKQQQHVVNPTPKSKISARGRKSKLTSKQIRNLQFRNPGKFMEDFDPERSSREMRKVQRRIYTERSRRKAIYDEKGLLLSSRKDVCDCLIKECNGCHYPCPKCGSEKCGAECRCNRTWCYGEIEVEGTSLKFTSDVK